MCRGVAGDIEVVDRVRGFDFSHLSAPSSSWSGRKTLTLSHIQPRLLVRYSGAIRGKWDIWGKPVLAAIDPDVWSGRALQEAVRRQRQAIVRCAVCPRPEFPVAAFVSLPIGLAPAEEYL